MLNQKIISIVGTVGELELKDWAYLSSFHVVASLLQLNLDDLAWMLHNLCDQYSAPSAPYAGDLLSEE